jgi:4-amino-4-deoxy-L-arabinose transferase-like glycosyltransferase
VNRDEAAVAPGAARAAHRVALAAWVVAWLACVALLAAVHYTSGDPDSRLYAGISAHLVTEPVERWIAPEWWGFWGLTGPYHEHPVGMFVVPAFAGRLGYPPEQAAYAINALYQVLSFALIVAIARSVSTATEARALGWLLQLLPIAFVFRIRANQEYAVLAAWLFALYATERTRTRPAWAGGMIAGFCGVLLVKGVFAFMVPVACAMWLIARGAVSRDADSQWARVPVVAWIAVALMPVAGVLVTWAYEAAYVHVTGRSFLEIYRARQVPEGALTEGSPVVRTAYTLVWYLGRVAWFAFPWALISAVAAWVTSRVNGVRVLAPPSGRWTDDRAVHGAWFAIWTSVLLVGAFSLAHRKADRYIFPVYFVLAAPGAVYAIRRWPWLQRIVARMDRPWVPAAVYVFLFLLRLVTRGKLPEFTFWRS